ncbi:MAG TPA: hypothetical protein VNH83_09045, partial [Bryobacteraceae bacterium]|nr:hypothetical protein [Bryobacteraceae bacterium]
CEVTSQASLVAHQLIPRFYNGYLYYLGEGRPSQIRLYAPDGHLVLATDLQEPGNSPPNLRGLAVDTDSTIAVSYGDTSDGNRGGITFLDSTGKRTGGIDTQNYLPGNLCYAEDHSLWSFGWQQDKDNPGRRDPKDHMLVRKYSGGKQVGAYLPRSAFPDPLEPGTDSWQEMRITVTHDRVGVLAWRESSDDLEWVELDLNGNLTGRWRVPGNRSETSFAFTSDNHLYALRRDRHGKIRRLFVLDHASSTLKEVDAPIQGALYGADGDELVFSGWGEGPMHLQWFKQPAAPTSASLPPATAQ